VRKLKKGQNWEDGDKIGKRWVGMSESKKENEKRVRGREREENYKRGDLKKW